MEPFSMTSMESNLTLVSLVSLLLSSRSVLVNDMMLIPLPRAMTLRLNFFLTGLVVFGFERQFLKICTRMRLIGNTIRLLEIPIMICSQEKLKGPRSALVYLPSSVLYHMALAIMVHRRRDRQQDSRCTRVNGLRDGRRATLNHR